MANVKISQLPEVTSPIVSDVIPIVDASTTSKVTIGNVAVAIGNSFNTVSATGDIKTAGNVYGGTGINTVATSYTIQLSDNGGTLASTSTSITTITAGGAGTYPTGFQVGLLQLGTGQIYLSAAPGTSLYQSNSAFKTSKQYSAATLLYTGASTKWVLFGDVTT